MNAQVLPTIATHRRLVVSRMVRWFVPAKKVMLEMVDNAQVNFINTQEKSIDNACLKKDTWQVIILWEKLTLFQFSPFKKTAKFWTTQQHDQAFVVTKFTVRCWPCSKKIQFSSWSNGGMLDHLINGIQYGPFKRGQMLDQIKNESSIFLFLTQKCWIVS